MDLTVACKRVSGSVVKGSFIPDSSASGSSDDKYIQVTLKTEHKSKMVFGDIYKRFREHFSDYAKLNRKMDKLPTPICQMGYDKDDKKPTLKIIIPPSYTYEGILFTKVYNLEVRLAFFILYALYYYFEGLAPTHKQSPYAFDVTAEEIKKGIRGVWKDQIAEKNRKCYQATAQKDPKDSTVIEHLNELSEPIVVQAKLLQVYPTPKAEQKDVPTPTPSQSNAVSQFNGSGAKAKVSQSGPFSQSGVFSKAKPMPKSYFPGSEDHALEHSYSGNGQHISSVHSYNDEDEKIVDPTDETSTTSSETPLENKIKNILMGDEKIEGLTIVQLFEKIPEPAISPKQVLAAIIILYEYSKMKQKIKPQKDLESFNKMEQNYQLIRVLLQDEKRGNHIKDHVFSLIEPPLILAFAARMLQAPATTPIASRDSRQLKPASSMHYPRYTPSSPRSHKPAFFSPTSPHAKSSSGNDSKDTVEQQTEAPVNIVSLSRTLPITPKPDTQDPSATEGTSSFPITEALRVLAMNSSPSTLSTPKTSISAHSSSTSSSLTAPSTTSETSALSQSSSSSSSPSSGSIHVSEGEQPRPSQSLTIT